MLKNGVLECSVCHSKLLSPNARAISKAYDRHRSNISSKHRALNFLLVAGDCVLVGLQEALICPIKLRICTDLFWFICPRWMESSNSVRSLLTF
ncbi:CMP-sialic acid transporter 3 [Platanthera guangdongensis]|uniref:CMP-sialic acid transporter 3 n=1 Tax=Platanthera guangdongensis TaxID=2320717 RepID=A0ABR2LCU9_9ASPA